MSNWLDDYEEYRLYEELSEDNKHRSSGSGGGCLTAAVMTLSIIGIIFLVI